MNQNRKRLVEVRLIVVVQVDVTHPDLVDTVAAAGGKPVAEIVASEVVSNFESVPYVTSVITSPL